MSNINAFIDNVGRVIVGDIVSSDDTELKVKEPAVVNVQVSQENGQISVQLLPFIFREFVEPKVREEGTVWSFPKNNIVVSENLQLEDAIKTQYNNIFNAPIATPDTKPSPEVVKLFDDDE